MVLLLAFRRPPSDLSMVGLDLTRSGMASPLVLLQIYTQTQQQPFWAFFTMSIFMVLSMFAVWPVPKILIESRDKTGVDGAYSPFTRSILSKEEGKA